jgi:hypothetical protein
MTRKVYKTANGKTVDLGALQLQNEEVRAVGNMGVNARGDLIDSMNRPIDSRNNRVNKQYGRQTNVQDTKIYSSVKSAESSVPVAPVVDIPDSPEDFDDDFVKPVDVPEVQETSGLAAAIAKARQVKQEPLKSARQLAQEQNKKI